MATAKRALGRGLADLIPVGGDAGAAGGNGGREVAIAALHPNPRQPRTQFDDASLNELAESIRGNGILQPILVRPRTAGGFEIVAGERRYRAALRAGLTQVPVVVRSLTDAETLALALIENLMREDIGPLETARAYRRLMDDFGLTQEEVGQRVGKSRSAVGNTVRLMDLPPVIQESLEKGEITEGHARTLLSEEKRHALPDFKARQLKVWRMIREKGLTVREVERLMRSAAETAPPAARRTSADLAAVQDRFRTALGYKVRIDGSEAQGKIVIDYYSADELEGILARIEGAAEEPTTPHRPTRGSGPIPGLLSSRRPSD